MRIYSRRKAEELIAAGKVSGQRPSAEIGMKVDVKKDLIAVDGQTVRLRRTISSGICAQ
jgi:16S rRNA U516 pseudouridylate synthase RsuA-like enzyme